MNCFDDRGPKTTWEQAREVLGFALIVGLTVIPVLPFFVVVWSLRTWFFWPTLVVGFALSLLALRAYWRLDRAAREVKRPRPGIELALFFIGTGGICGCVVIAVARGVAALAS